MSDNVVKFVKGDPVQYVGHFADDSDIGTVVAVDGGMAWVRWGGGSSWGEDDCVVSTEEIEHQSVSIEVPADVAEALAAGKYYLEDQKILTDAAKAALKEANGD